MQKYIRRCREEKNKKVEESSALIGKVFDSFETDSHHLVINANFQIWQRGAEFNNIGNAVYCADRWRVYRQATGTANIIKVNNGLQITGDFNIYQPVNKDEYAWLIDRETIITKCINGVARKYNRIQQEVENTNYISLVSVNRLKPGDIVNWVKVELGFIATPFVPRLNDEEIILYKRYFKLCNEVGGFEYKYPNNLKRILKIMNFGKMHIIPNVVSFKAQGESGGCQHIHIALMY